MKKIFPCAFLISLFLCLPGALSAVAPVLNRFWVPDGDVYDVEEYDGVIYAGGAFMSFGPRTGAAVAVDPSTGAAFLHFPEFNWWVTSVISDGAGGWYVAGSFTYADSVPRNGLAHVNPDLTLDLSWNPGVDANIITMAVHNGKLYCAGAFHSIGGEFRDYFAELDAATGWATPLNLHVQNGYVSQLSLSGDVLYIAGGFDKAGGADRNNAAAIDTQTGALLGWDPQASGGNIFCIEASGDTVFAGGDFTSIGGRVQNCLAAVEAYPSTGSAYAWAPSIGGRLETFSNTGVYDLETGSGMLYAAGNFTSAESLTRNGLCSYEISTGLLDQWQPDSAVPVTRIEAAGNTVFVTSNCLEWDICGGKRRTIAAITAAPGACSLLDWDPRVNGAAEAAAYDGTSLYIYGFFSSYGMIKRNGLAALDAATGELLPWDPGLKPEMSYTGPISIVRSIEVRDGTVYAAGSFTWAGGADRQNVAALDIETGLAEPLDIRPDPGNVWDMKIYGGKMYLAGFFSAVNSQPKQNLASVDMATGQVDAWLPAFDNGLFSIALSGGTLYTGGIFMHAGGQPRQALASFDIATGLVTGWDPQPDGEIYHMEADGNTLFVSGSFSSVAGSDRQFIASVDTASAAAGAWLPDCDYVLPGIALVKSENRFYGQRNDGLYSYELNPAADKSFFMFFDNRMEVLKYINGRLFAGGNFSRVGNSYCPGFAVIGVRSAPTPAPTAAPVDYSGTTLSVKLIKNYPNPFDEKTTITYELSRPAAISLSIYAISGELVYRQKCAGYAGLNDIVWDGVCNSGKKAASGIYIYSLTAGMGFESMNLMGRLARIGK
jgi:hypothetical protein